LRVEWSPREVTTASLFLEDATGMTAVVAALDVVEGELITIQRVDRVTAD
jgi:hypothetical protein